MCYEVKGGNCVKSTLKQKQKTLANEAMPEHLSGFVAVLTLVYGAWVAAGVR